MSADDHNEDPQPHDDHHHHNHNNHDDDDDAPQCRFCLGGAEDGRLISPCLCKGSIRFVHSTCLERWRRSSANPASFFQCDQCHYRYSFRRSQAARVFGSPLMRLVVTLVLFAVLTVVAGWAMKVGLWWGMDVQPANINRADWDVIAGTIVGDGESPRVVKTVEEQRKDERELEVRRAALAAELERRRGAARRAALADDRGAQREGGNRSKLLQVTEELLSVGPVQAPAAVKEVSAETTVQGSWSLVDAQEKRQRLIGVLHQLRLLELDNRKLEVGDLEEPSSVEELDEPSSVEEPDSPATTDDQPPEDTPVEVDVGAVGNLDLPSPAVDDNPPPIGDNPPPIADEQDTHPADVYEDTDPMPAATSSPWLDIITLDLGTVVAGLLGVGFFSMTSFVLRLHWFTFRSRDDVSSVLLLILIAIGVLKAMRAVYRFVERRSQLLLQRAEDMVENVGEEIPARAM